MPQDMLRQAGRALPPACPQSMPVGAEMEMEGATHPP